MGDIFVAYDAWAMDFIELSTSEAAFRIDTDLWFGLPDDQNFVYDAPLYDSYEWGTCSCVPAFIEPSQIATIFHIYTIMMSTKK